MAAILDFICKSWKYKFFVVFRFILHQKKIYLATKTTILSKLFHVLWQFSRFSFKMAAILDLPRLGVCRGVPTLFKLFFHKSYINWQLCRGYPDKTGSNIGPYYERGLVIIDNHGMWHIILVYFHPTKTMGITKIHFEH